MAVASSTGSLTVLGVEEMVLQVMPDDTIGYVNAPMAKLLGMPDRRKPLGSALDHWDHGPIGEGVLAGLCQVARTSHESHVLERSCTDVPHERLPDIALPESVEARLLRFTAAGQKGRVQIVAQDVTRLRWLECTFSRYVSPKVIERMQNLSASEFLGMERKELTVLFGDLRGFTAMCQQLPPEEVQETVNSFLGNMVDAIERLDGTIDKFVGDEVMAIFGAPVDQPDHAIRALVCAVEMQKAHAKWEKDRQDQGKPHRPLGIGLATGKIVVGNVGTETRMDYTVLGHTVNLAARLCGGAEGGEIFTVPHTHQSALKNLKAYQGDIAIPRFHFEPKGKQSFKNVAEPVEVIAVEVETITMERSYFFFRCVESAGSMPQFQPRPVDPAIA